MSTMEPNELETISVTPSTRRYLEALDSYGSLEGEPGEQQLPDGVRDLLHGLHHVLGGGTVSVEVRNDGTSSVVAELDAAMRDAVTEVGDLRRRAGFVRF